MLSAEKSYFRWSNQYLIQLKRISLLCLCVCVCAYENKFSNSEHIRPICCYFINYSKWQKFRKIFHFIWTSMFYTCIVCLLICCRSMYCVAYAYTIHDDGDEDDEDNGGGGKNNNNNNNGTGTGTRTIQWHTHFAMRLWYANGAPYTSFILIWVPVIDENDPSFSFPINEDYRQAGWLKWEKRTRNMRHWAPSIELRVIRVKERLDFSNPLQVGSWFVCMCVYASVS